MMVLPILSNLALAVFSFVRLIYWYGEALFRAFIRPPPMKSLDGEGILITGAAGGIGSALCRHLVSSSKNLKLAMWDVNRLGMEGLVEELEHQGARCYVYVVDISSKEDIQRAASLVKNDIGPVSIGHLTTAYPSWVRTRLMRSVVLVKEEMPFFVPASLEAPLEPETVAKEVVDGMRRELEYVYVPQAVALMPYIENLVPLKMRKVIMGMVMKCGGFTDPNDAKVLEEGHRTVT